MEFKYGVNDRPPWPRLLLFGLQWLAIIVPMTLIVGKVVASLQFKDPLVQITYLQKLFFLVGLSLLAQVLWGHRLPVLIGPATVLMVGIAASQGSSVSSVYTGIAVGGLLLALLSATGLFGHLRRLFTPRVVAAILQLIAISLGPTMLHLLLAEDGKGSPTANLLFGLVFVLIIFVAGRYLRGLWKATLIVWAVIGGSVFYALFFPRYHGSAVSGLNLVAGFFQGFTLHPSFDPGVLIAFLICFLAVAVNDVGSIQSINEMLQATDMQGRITRGVTVTGLVNFVSGLFGVVGSVNFSVSAGVIIATGVASRFTLLPAGLGLVALAFLPRAISFTGYIPSVVIGGILIYLMTSQMAAALQMAFHSAEDFSFESGLVMGMPALLCVVISFLPVQVVNSFPALLRPIIGNGFVVGVVAAMIMEHVIYRPDSGKVGPS
ncbi:Permease family [Acididesulfobacillus acetoxydans]|uniref:Permease family n=1 Tax=Acididesulfobacillus acetoxydans TaxID=1561005 RepID=A0A8S0X683_9FIRM|nr:solute carrier family 23 protein [Acididesulfobacillus acetoxydans]CAA7602310.1 Permease family [Acididesulfobacillus acetoxydans]CEJ08765.1 Predicted xanthine/uracil permease protein [Acididesulfobacillus acetoxydans]